MGKETRLFKSKERKSRSDVSAFLRQIAEKIESGEVILRRGQEETVLKIPENLILEVEIEDEQKKSKGLQYTLEIEIKWFENDVHSNQLELG